MQPLSNRTNTFTDSVIRRMTRINNQYDSINLSQGFPDFDPPKELTDALAEGLLRTVMKNATPTGRSSSPAAAPRR